MDARENAEVMRIITASAVQREPLTADQSTSLVAHLSVLPFNPIYERVAVYLLSHRWLSTPAELMDACDLPDETRRDVVRAVHQGGRVVRNQRAYPTGWSYVAPDEPDPLGALELERLHDPAVQAALATGAPLPGPIDLPPERRALPTTGDPEATRGLMAHLAAADQGRPVALGAIVAAPPPTPERLRFLAAEAAAARGDTERARQAHLASVRVYEQRLREIEDDLLAADDLGAGAPMAAVKAAARRLLLRVAADELEGPGAVLEIAVAAAWPHLVVAAVDRPPGQFDDEPPSRLQIKLEPKPPPAPPKPPSIEVKRTPRIVREPRRLGGRDLSRIRR